MHSKHCLHQLALNSHRNFLSGPQKKRHCCWSSFSRKCSEGEFTQWPSFPDKLLWEDAAKFVTVSSIQVCIATWCTAISHDSFLFILHRTFLPNYSTLDAHALKFIVETSHEWTLFVRADVTLSELVPSIIVVASQYFATEISAWQTIECNPRRGSWKTYVKCKFQYMLTTILCLYPAWFE